MNTAAFTPLRMPSLYCPGPAKAAPDARRLDANTIAWMDRLGVYCDPEQRDYLARMNIGHFASLTIPDGPAERRQVYSDLIAWVFAFDDAVFDEPRPGTPLDTRMLLLRLDRTLDTPHSPLPGGDPWQVAGIRDIRLRLQHIASPAQLRRHVTAIRKYLMGATLTTPRLLGPHDPQDVPSLNDYMMIRLGDGTMATWELIPILGGYEVPARELDDARVRALEEMTDILTMWDNDLFAYNKEAYRAARYGYPTKNNLLTVLARQDNSTPERVLDQAIAMRDRIMLLFQRLRQQALHEASPELARYLTGLGDWHRGYLEWALFVTNRYTEPGNPSDPIQAERLTIPPFAEQPTNDNPHPLPVPTIAWWWEQLR